MLKISVFLIHVAPQSQHTTIDHYCNMLAKHHILPYFSAGALEVHLIFDDPGRFPTSPKAADRQRRYQSTNADHTHYNFREQLPNTQKWKTAMECTKCKHQLAMHLAYETLQRISKYLLPNQHFITAGAFEEDLRDKALSVWVMVQVKHTFYHIWHAPLKKLTWESGCIVPTRLALKSLCSHQTRMYSTLECFFLDTQGWLNVKSLYNSIHLVQSKESFSPIKHACVCLQNNPDLTTVPTEDLLQIIQTLYIVTGCVILQRYWKTNIYENIHFFCRAYNWG